MSKRVLSFIVVTGLFGLANFAFAGSVTLTPPIAATDFCELFTSIANVIAMLIGALGTIMIIVSAILYLTSAGSPEKIGTAKKALIYAIVGIAIGISAGTIVAIIRELITAGGGSCGAP